VKPMFATVVFAILCWSAAAAQSPESAPTPAATAGPTAPPAGQSSPEEKLTPEAVARKYVEVWNTGNFDLLNSIFTFPAGMTSHGYRSRLDASTLKRVITAWRNSMPDLNFKIEDTIVQGNKVAMRLSFTGSYEKRLFANTADPKDLPRKLRGTAMWMFEVPDGKIKLIWEEYDEIRMHYAMGGFWRSNQELEAAAKAAARTSQPKPQSTPPSAPPAKP